MAKARKAAGWAVIAVAAVAGFEGLRTNAYRDASPARVVTICFGETKGVRMGDTKTPAECRAMLEGRLWEFHDGVWACTPGFDAMPPTRQAAVVSLAYNIGIGAYCKSSVARLLNAGHVRAGCDAFLKWVKAGGITLPGLVKRREEERRLCLA